ncbi:uncharacterized protein BDR25DRAFT_361451 [Lindgomyces ingoldianus]|uniref:Uncharacterized protein n=1 Tax=Lindgomyces ingoldianus TaxID=673940 RepID=A0ACB6QCF0_9PLEO|nr:uncharacterized protein BDR25DRAFT_361451 [Lindgomyces ingoldianus]KAF2464613.1 hypothetical protein BDR25DRAFT_361451 [Lindgomyces ingoldianus]
MLLERLLEPLLFFSNFSETPGKNHVCWMFYSSTTSQQGEAAILRVELSSITFSSVYDSVRIVSHSACPPGCCDEICGKTLTSKQTNLARKMVFRARRLRELSSLYSIRLAELVYVTAGTDPIFPATHAPIVFKSATPNLKPFDTRDTKTSCN